MKNYKNSNYRDREISIYFFSELHSLTLFAVYVDHETVHLTAKSAYKSRDHSFIRATHFDDLLIFLSFFICHLSIPYDSSQHVNNFIWKLLFYKISQDVVLPSTLSLFIIVLNTGATSTVLHCPLSASYHRTVYIYTEFNAYIYPSWVYKYSKKY